MNIKKTLFSLFIVVSGLPFAMQAGEQKIVAERDLPADCLTIPNEKYDLFDWSPLVKPQRNNQCGYRAVIAGKAIRDYLLDPTMSKAIVEAALNDESAIANGDKKQDFACNENVLDNFARSRDVQQDRFTIMTTPLNLMAANLNNGFRLQDLSVGAHDYGTPHIFVVKASEPSNGNSLSDLARKTGHWVTCVVQQKNRERLQFHYADTLDETEAQVMPKDIELSSEEQVQYASMLEQTKQEIYQRKVSRRNTTTHDLYSIIHKKYPAQEPEDLVLKSTQALLDEVPVESKAENTLAARIAKKQQKSWWQRSLNTLKSYITPKRLMLSSLCAAGCWLLNKIYNNKNPQLPKIVA